MKWYSVMTMLLGGVIFLLTAYSPIAKSGATQGMALCEGIIIPSLLPMLIITGIIVRSRCSEVINRLFGGITEKIFRLPRVATTAIVSGLIGGFPTGAILTEQLYNRGAINSKTARRIMRFNFCGGIAFIITAIGTAGMRSTRNGVVLYASCVLSSIIIGIVQGLFSEKIVQDDNKNTVATPLSDALIESVDNAVHSIMLMCAYIILFCAITNLIPIPEVAKPIIEITNGLTDGGNMTLPKYAAYLTFGGICIHFQLIGTMTKMKTGYGDFLLFRLIGTAISYAIAKIYTIIFPSADTVFSNIGQSTPALTQVNTGLSIVMLLGCVVIIFDVENKKSKLI